MLSLIPAVLILILHGPAGVERMPVDGRLSQALKIWAGKQIPTEDGLAELLSERGCGELTALLSLTKGSPEFSRFVAEVLQISAALPVRSDSGSLAPIPDTRAESVPNGPGLPLLSGFATCGRTRDGPLA